MLKSKLYLAAASVGLFLSGGAPAQAQGNLNNAMGHLRKTGGRAGTTQENLDQVAGTVINTALSLVGLIFLVLMVYGGYLWMTARGEESQIDKAKSIIRSAIIGIVIVMSAYAITFLVTSRLEAVG